MVDAVDAPVQVQLAVARSFVQRVQAEILVFFLMPLIAAVPIIMLLLRVGYGRALQPLALLASTITSRDVQSTAPLACPDPEYQELRPVFNSVNELLSRLATFREGEQRFFADAAHELRTPLAAIGAQVHLLARAESEQERAALAALLDASIARSGELVGKLLTLSRLDAESAQVRSEPFDLAAGARGLVAARAARAGAQYQPGLRRRAGAALPRRRQRDGRLAGQSAGQCDSLLPGRRFHQCGSQCRLRQRAAGGAG